MTSSAVWMERLRSKSSQFKSLTEQSKSARTALLERRYGLDSEEKSALRACLDHLSEAIPVRDAVSMAERLEAIARKTTSESGGTVNLSFMAAPVHGCFYLSTEMFYLEINIDSAGVVNEAKVHHIDATQQQHQQQNNRVRVCRDCIGAKIVWDMFVDSIGNVKVKGLILKGTGLKHFRHIPLLYQKSNWLNCHFVLIFWKFFLERLRMSP
jgi:hypothetical protein